MSGNELSDYDRGYMEGKRAADAEYTRGVRDGIEAGYDDGYDEGEDHASENCDCWFVRDMDGKCVRIGDLVHPKDWYYPIDTRVLALGDGVVYVASGHGETACYNGDEVKKVGR